MKTAHVLSLIVVTGFILAIAAHVIEDGKQAWNSRPITAYVQPIAPVAAPAQSVPNYLESISVTVKAGEGAGSGIVFSRKDAAGNLVNFVWTAGHVAEHIRHIRPVTMTNGVAHANITFGDVEIFHFKFQDGKAADYDMWPAKVIRFSDSDTGDDVALLQITANAIVDVSTRFLLDSNPPAIGSELYHVGSFRGSRFPSSLSTGIVSQHSRFMFGQTYDQVSITAVPGSSGGGVFLQDGRCIGLLILTYGETINFINPARRMLAWARKNDVEWAMNPDVPMPSAAELAALPVDDGKTKVELPKVEPAPVKPTKKTPVLRSPKDQDNQVSTPEHQSNPFDIILDLDDLFKH